jgi:hypothetical protein
MSAEVRLQPLTEHGSELLNELVEHSTYEFPVKVEELTRATVYYLASGESADALEAELDSLDPGWREHLVRTQ